MLSSGAARIDHTDVAPPDVQIAIVVSGTLAVRRADLPARVFDRLRDDLSFPNPKFIARQRMGRYLGNIPERIDCLTESNGWLHLPRGSAQRLRARLAEAGIAHAFLDRRTVGEPLDEMPAIAVRPYQAEAVAEIVRATQGTVIMPCGGGKTVVGAAAIRAIGRAALVIVHTRDLLEQWIGVLRERLGLDAGVVTEGEVHPGPVTVATVQTLIRLDAELFDGLAERFGTVIVDEAHHAPASTFQSVLARLPSRWRVGLTATPDREDGLGPLLDLTLGRRLFEIGYAELVAQGYLESPEIEAVHTDFTFDYQGPEDLHRCLAALVADPQRNALIADLVAREAQGGYSVLVLSGRVDHCRHLAELVRTRGVGAAVLVGSICRDRRRTILDELRDGTVRVVIASTVADEGLDVPRLDRIVLAYPSRTRGRTTQRLGRLMRPHPGKGRAVLFDIVDERVPVLQRQYVARRRLYRELLP